MNETERNFIKFISLWGKFDVLRHHLGYERMFHNSYTVNWNNFNNLDLKFILKNIKQYFNLRGVSYQGGHKKEMMNLLNSLPNDEDGLRLWMDLYWQDVKSEFFKINLF